jgi:hypothetical protein
MKPIGNVNHVATSRSSSKNTRKSNVQPIWNIELFRTHIGLELGMVGVAKKLVKDVVHM